MTTFLLVRHATNARVGRSFAGRAPGTHLSAEGLTQAGRLAEALASRDIAAVYASPLERAGETAAPIARRLGLAVCALPGLTEIDVGDWTGRAFDELAADERWRPFNDFRGGTRPPGGELLLEAQARAVGALLELRERHGERTVVVVTHADVIRAVLGHFAGVPMDLLQRFEVDPASVTELELHDWGPRIVRVNATPGAAEQGEGTVA